MQARTVVPAGRENADRARTIQRLSIIGIFLILAVLSFTRNVQWDEFYFLSHVHAWLDGRLDRPMQTFFVHAFGWLRQVSADEITQIAAARTVMVGCLAVTCWAIYRVAVMMTDGAAARLAVLGFLTSGFVLPFGTNFRADPIAASLLMAAVATMMTSRMRAPAVVSVALLSALALLVTVKAVIYAPVFLGALLFRAKDRGVVLRILLSGCLALAFAVLAYLWHASGLVVAAGNDTATNARDALFTALLSGELFPRRSDILLWAVLSLPSLLLAVAGLRGGPSYPGRIVLWAFALPLLSLVVYRNAFPYFFPFLAPPVMVLAAVGIHRLRNDERLKIAVVMMFVFGLGQTILSAREVNFDQKETLREVHRLFPDPVPYIDQHGMVSAFPRQGFFMSTWGLQNYRAAGQPVFADIIARASPPLLLANRVELAQAVRFGDSRPGAFLPEDQAILQQSYVHYAGAIWLAGRAVTGTGAELSISMPMAGDYRVESPAPVVIDGVTYAPKDQVTLGLGPHRLLSPADTHVRLIWATSADTSAPPDLPEDGLYSGFWRLF